VTKRHNQKNETQLKTTRENDRKRLGLIGDEKKKNKTDNLRERERMKESETA